jgi:hypothetical protein
MTNFLKIALWNASGLTKHIELMTFLSLHDIDVMLISETYFADKSYLKLQNFSVFHTNHPAGSALGGTGIITKATIKHNLQSSYRQDYLQATSISVKDTIGPITIAAIYFPPKFTVKQEHLEEFCNILGQRFTAERDNNAEHIVWRFQTHHSQRS